MLAKLAELLAIAKISFQHEIKNKTVTCRVVSRFLSRRFHPKSRRLFPFYFSNITLRTDLLTFGVTGAVFKIAGEMRRLPAYFDNHEHGGTVLTEILSSNNVKNELRYSLYWKNHHNSTFPILRYLKIYQFLITFFVTRCFWFTL